MRLYSTHFAAGQTGALPVLVKEGVCWPCLLLGWIGLLLAGSWTLALLAGAITFGLVTLLHGTAEAWPVLAGWQLVVGVFANDWRRREFRWRGFAQGPLVAGRTADGALLRLLDQRPDLVESSR